MTNTKQPLYKLEKCSITPGLWKVDDLFSGVFGYEVVDNNGNTIADCYKNSYYRKRENGREIGRANAAHIVKCVNNHNTLIEALKKAVSVIKEWHNADDVWEIYYNNAPEMREIREALNRIS